MKDRYPHSTANIRLAKHGTAISAVAEFLLFKTSLTVAVLGLPVGGGSGVAMVFGGVALNWNNYSPPTMNYSLLSLYYTSPENVSGVNDFASIRVVEMSIRAKNARF